MLLGAVCGFMAGLATGNPILAILAAGLAGAGGALIYAFITVTLQGNQNVTGLVLTTFGTGLSSFLGKDLVGQSLPDGIFAALGPKEIPVLSDIPVVGKMLFHQSLYATAGLVLAILLYFYMNRTTMGLNMRAVGENPGAADSVGINVKWYKYLHICLGCGIMGIGGYYMSLNMSGSFNSSCWINGYGWIAVALVIFANWNPALAILGTFVFGFFNTLRVSGGSLAAAFPDTLGWLGAVPSQLYQALPFIITAIVLVATSIRQKGSGQPAGLGLNYFREER